MKPISTNQSVIRILFWVLLFISAFCLIITSFLGVLRFQALNQGFYCRALADQKVDHELYDLVCKEVKAECDYNGFPAELILDAISKESVVSSKNSYVAVFFDKLFSSEKTDAVRAKYNAEDILAAIEKYADSSAEEAKLYIRAENRQLLADSLQEIIESVIGSVSIGTYQKLVQKIQPRFITLSGWTAYFPFIAILEILLILILCWFIFFMDNKRLLYSAALFHFGAIQFVFIPFVMLYFYNLPKRIAIEESSLILYFRAIWNRIVSIDCIVFGVLSVLLFVLFIYAALQGKKNNTSTVEEPWITE